MGNFFELTERQLQVCKLHKKGYSVRKISKKLDLSGQYIYKILETVEEKQKAAKNVQDQIKKINMG